MSLDDTVNLERLATAFEKIALALQERNIIERERMAREFPVSKTERRPAEIIYPKKERDEQSSYKADNEWFEETEKAVPSRFQERLNKQTSQPARGRATTVPKTNERLT